MSRNITKTLVSALTVGASSSAILDMDLYDVQNMQVLVEATYAATGSTTGLSLDLKGGFGGSDETLNGLAADPFPHKVGGSSVPVFGDNVEAVTLAPTLASQGSETISRTSFYFNEVNTRWPRWARMVFYNNDTVNDCSVRILVDL